MNTKLYEIEKKLGITSSKPCSPAEEDAVKRVLAQGNEMPVGIYKNKHGKFFKYDTEGMSDAEKEKFAVYSMLLQIKNIKGLLILLVIVNVIIAIAVILSIILL